jgi:hypothetical protein
MASANRYLTESYRAAFNSEFMQPAMEDGSAFVTWIGGPLEDILCERFERQVGADNCVSFEGVTLQIPADRHRCHYVKAKVAVLRRIDGTLAILPWPAQACRLRPQSPAPGTQFTGGRVGPPRPPGAGKSVPGYALHRFPRPAQSGQFICYRTGQIYLMPTCKLRNCDPVQLHGLPPVIAARNRSGVPQ